VIKFGYVYHTHCKVSKKHYIGQHQGSTFNPVYYGSGKIIRCALEKYGEDAFEVTPIKWCSSKEEMNIEEIWQIAKFRKQLGIKKMYNISTGGEGPSGYRHSKQMLEHLSEMRKGRRLSAEHRKAIGLGNKGKPLSAERREKIRVALLGKPSWNKGKHWSAATKKRMTDAAQNRTREHGLKIWRTRREKYGASGKRP